MKKIILVLCLFIHAILYTNAQELKYNSNGKLIAIGYTPLKVDGNSISLTNSKIDLDKNGFPKQIQTFNNSSLAPVKLLYENIHFHFVKKSDGKNIILNDGGVQFIENNTSTEKFNRIVKWKSTSKNDSLIMEVIGKLKFDGKLVYRVKVVALQAMVLNDVTMHIPFIPALPTHMIGFGILEGVRPEKVEWKWDGPFKNENGAWLGNPDAGLKYILQKGAWENKNKGGVTIGIKGSSMLANNYTGEHEMKKGEERYYNFKLLVKPYQFIKK